MGGGGASRDNQGASSGRGASSDETLPLLGRTPQETHPLKLKTIIGWLVPLEESQQTSVFKAVLAYAIAALFPFIPFLRDWLGDPDYMSPHLVTNATIWLHAARTRSALAEGGLVSVIWVCVTSCVAYMALYTAEYLHCTYASSSSGVSGNEGLPEALPLATQSKVACLVVFVFGYSWCLAFFKANSNRISVATGTTIANIVLYLVMLREAPIVNYKAAANGSCPNIHAQDSGHGGGGRVPWPGPDGDEDSLAESVGKKAEHILVAVLTGMAISLTVGWFVRPTTSRALLRKKLGTALDSFRDILPQLLAPIINVGNEQTTSYYGDVPNASNASRRKRRDGAKPAELKSAIHAHWEQLQALKTQLTAISLDPTDRRVWARRSQVGLLVGRLEELGLRLNSMGSGLELQQTTDRNNDPGSSYASIVSHIHIPVLQLSRMCDKTLMAIHDMVGVAFAEEEEEGEDAATVARKIERLRLEMTSAIHEFHTNYSEAVCDLDTPVASRTNDSNQKSTEEQLFVVHFFVYSLREFADELFDVLPYVESVCLPPLRLARASIIPGIRSFALWACCHFRALWDTGATSDLETRYEFAQFADPRSLHTPRPVTRSQRLAHTIWRILTWARQINVKFATKYALLITLLSLPCYWSMDMYLAFHQERMDWMVISAAAIMVPTVGGSLVVSVYRVLGTCAGGLAAFLVYEIANKVPVLMYMLLVLFSIPCFHIMLHGKYPKIGQFALITFGVVLINKWVAREDRLESIGTLAVRRTASVALGVLAGMLVTMYVWPYEARVRVRKALSWWLLRASLLYDRLWSDLWQSSAMSSGATNRMSEDDSDDEWDDALDTVRDYLESELELQGSLVEIRALLALTASEPRLKGPYPARTYERIANACQRLLDAMVAARWVVLPVHDSSSLRNMMDLPIELASQQQQQQEMGMPSSSSSSLSSLAVVALLAALEREHRDSLVTLSMYVLASALVLKTPLPAVLPPTQSAQHRVARAMQDVLDPAEDTPVYPHDPQAAAMRVRYVFYYTQVMLGWEVVRELDVIGAQMRELYGSY
ncbi:hypothetical protein IW140_002192 [Coemansia sp. RSA 1813]|nr:hypothetical protein EV178_001342 [Coemansia sp. RSA 1646]KAJ2570765.1 hypothetical protein IW140_002192 [Coemansia sp. RSA 1813]